MEEKHNEMEMINTPDSSSSQMNHKCSRSLLSQTLDKDYEVKKTSESMEDCINICFSWIYRLTADNEVCILTASEYFETAVCELDGWVMS